MRINKLCFVFKSIIGSNKMQTKRIPTVERIELAAVIRRVK